MRYRRRSTLVRLKNPRFSARFRAWKGIRSLYNREQGCWKKDYREYGGRSGRRTRKIEEEARLKLKEGSTSGCSQETKAQVIEAWSSATVIHG
jgi:hypothetical protein